MPIIVYAESAAMLSYRLMSRAKRLAQISCNWVLLWKGYIFLGLAQVMSICQVVLVDSTLHIRQRSIEFALQGTGLPIPLYVPTTGNQEEVDFERGIQTVQHISALLNQPARCCHCVQCDNDLFDCQSKLGPRIVPQPSTGFQHR